MKNINSSLARTIKELIQEPTRGWLLTDSVPSLQDSRRAEGKKCLLRPD